VLLPNTTKEKHLKLTQQMAVKGRNRLDRKLTQQSPDDQQTDYGFLSTFSAQQVSRDIPKRFIFFVLDGQDLSSPSCFFTHIEVNSRLNALINPKTWESKAAQQMTDFY